MNHKFNIFLALQTERLLIDLLTINNSDEVFRMIMFPWRELILPLCDDSQPTYYSMIDKRTTCEVFVPTIAFSITNKINGNT